MKDKKIKSAACLKRAIALGLTLLIGLSACKDAKAPSNQGSKTPSALQGKEVLALAAPLSTPKNPNIGEDYDENASGAFTAFWNRLEETVRASQFKEPLYEYTQKMNQALLTGSEENMIYSPLNTYMCLSLLAETGGDKTQEEILQALDLTGLEESRKSGRDMSEVFNYNDGLMHVQSANAVWLGDHVKTRPEALERLNKDYRASLFQGQMGSPEMNKLFQSWLKENTGGLLDKAAENETLDPQTLFALSSTLYFKGSWIEDFEKSMTEDQVFHGSQGDQNLPFMHTERTETVCQGDSFDALALPFDGPAKLWIIRPKDGDFDRLLASSDLQTLLKNPSDYPDRTECQVKLAVPKLDVQSQFSLNEALQKLGIREVFDGEKADLTGLLQENPRPLAVDASHASRFIMDEEGAEAAAFTVIKGESAMAPVDNTYEFTVDHPFLFVLTAFNDSPLMVGRVNQLGQE